MSTGETNPLLISAPPPSPAAPVEAQTAGPAAVDHENFITLPPGITESGTRKIPAPRPVRADRPLRSEVSFFPAMPGSVQPAPAAPVTAPASLFQLAPDVEETLLAGPRDAGSVWQLVLPNGDRVSLAERVILGRNPSSSDEWPAAILMAIDDPTKSLSKTHAMLEVEDGVLWVRDLDSTNGVFVVQGDDVVDVFDGRVAVPDGAELELGQYVLRVERT